MILLKNCSFGVEQQSLTLLYFYVPFKEYKSLERGIQTTYIDFMGHKVIIPSMTSWGIRLLYLQ
jgi:hypothetical protein